MAIALPHSCLHDEQDQQMQIMALRNLQMLENDDVDDDDAGLEEDLKGLRARVEALQQDEDDVLSAESWDWAVGVEGVARQAVERMAQEKEAIQRALSSSSQRLGEEEAVASLRAEAARVGVLRGYSKDVAAATRRLREADLRRLAADAETGYYNYILILTHEELAAAAKMEFLAVAMEEWMASLAARLNRGAAEFAATPGEEAFVAAMRMEAGKAEDARSALARYHAAAAGGSLPPFWRPDGAGLAARAQAIDPSISISFQSLAQAAVPLD